MTPVFGHGHLRLYILSLLDESPRHGYDLIQALSDRFGGTYIPSAGTIYPRLAKLEEEGLVTKTTDGRKTVYAITDAGRREVAERRGELEDIEAELSDSVRRLADEVRVGVNQAMKSLKADLASAARDARTAGKQRESQASGETSARRDSSAALREAEVALAEFRQQVRLELRRAVSGGGLDPEIVRRMRGRLNEVRDEVRAELRGASVPPTGQR
jgi:DNA-binding PadR family transcriptional regulator